MSTMEERDKAHYIVQELLDCHQQDAIDIIATRNRIERTPRSEEKTATETKLDELKAEMQKNAKKLVEAKNYIARNNFDAVLTIGRELGIVD